MHTGFRSTVTATFSQDLSMYLTTAEGVDQLQISFGGYYAAGMTIAQAERFSRDLARLVEQARAADSRHRKD
ncbi:hypothetical protein AB0L82_35760 [Nocardia sp. NPDC052001]|uniref:hypothetical protein n=1 Tax=Nocardia sp. NPDC052001 TaxID=3154853 RepID=UPI00342DD16B